MNSFFNINVCLGIALILLAIVPTWAQSTAPREFINLRRSTDTVEFRAKALEGARYILRQETDKLSQLESLPDSDSSKARQVSGQRNRVKEAEKSVRNLAEDLKVYVDRDAREKAQQSGSAPSSQPVVSGGSVGNGGVSLDLSDAGGVAALRQIFRVIADHDSREVMRLQVGLNTATKVDASGVKPSEAFLKYIASNPEVIETLRASNIQIDVTDVRNGKKFSSLDAFFESDLWKKTKEEYRSARTAINDPNGGLLHQLNARIKSTNATISSSNSAGDNAVAKSVIESTEAQIVRLEAQANSDQIVSDALVESIRDASSKSSGLKTLKAIAKNSAAGVTEATAKLERGTKGTIPDIKGLERGSK